MNFQLQHSDIQQYYRGGKNYDLSIILMKCIATFFVLNSHMSICYPENFRFLSSGGAIGNALFFFISGFTLFLSKPTDFFNYYKKRIARVYPAVIGMALFACLTFYSSGNIIYELTRYWFINCIMIYYAILWFCRYCKLNIPFIICVASCISIFLLLYSFNFKSGNLIYSDLIFRYFLYFTFMAQGAFIGLHRDSYKCRWYHYFLLVTSFVSWYVFIILFKNNALQLLSLLSLFVFCYSLYVVGRVKWITTLIKLPYVNWIIYFCGALCLEVYLIQKLFFTSALNFIFPLNIPVIMGTVILGAYLLHIFSNIFVQTFEKNPYNYKKIFQL